MPAPPPTLAVLREAMSRATNREGIPMYVALVDERGAIPNADDPGLRADGDAIAERVRAVHAELAPSMRDGDNGGVISALVVAAHETIKGDPSHG